MWGTSGSIGVESFPASPRGVLLAQTFESLHEDSFVTCKNQQAFEWFQEAE
jgi:hypothetical protein